MVTLYFGEDGYIERLPAGDARQAGESLEAPPQRDGADANRHRQDAPDGCRDTGMPAQDGGGSPRRRPPAGAAGTGQADALGLRTAGRTGEGGEYPETVKAP